MAEHQMRDFQNNHLQKKKRIPFDCICRFGKANEMLRLKNPFILSHFIPPFMRFFHSIFANNVFFQMKTWIYELSLSQISMHDLQMLNVPFI